MKYIIILLLSSLPFLAIAQHHMTRKITSFVANTKIHKPHFHALVDIGYASHKTRKYFRHGNVRKHRDLKRSRSDVRLFAKVFVNWK